MNRVGLGLLITMLLLGVFTLGAHSRRDGAADSAFAQLQSLLLAIRQHVPMSLSLSIPIEGTREKIGKVPLSLYLDMQVSRNDAGTSAVSAQPSEEIITVIEGSSKPLAIFTTTDGETAEVELDSIEFIYGTNDGWTLEHGLPLSTGIVVDIGKVKSIEFGPIASGEGDFTFSMLARLAHQNGRQTTALIVTDRAYEDADDIKIGYFEGETEIGEFRLPIDRVQRIVVTTGEK